MEEIMSNKKPGYSLEQHDKLALELQTMRDRLTNIVVELSAAYPLSVYKYATKALEAVDTLRSTMDDEVCREQSHNKEVKATYIYYRAGRKDYIRKPKPIYPLREIKGGK